MITVTRLDQEATPDAIDALLKSTDFIPDPAPGPSIQSGRSVVGISETDNALLLFVTPAIEGGILQIHCVSSAQKYCRAAVSSLADGVPSRIIVEHEPDTLDFAGRTLKVHGSCQMKNAQSLACWQAGQMDWSIFETAAGAQKELLTENLKRNQCLAVWKVYPLSVLLSHS